MGKDAVRDLTQNTVVQRLGVPTIPQLRRFTPGQPLLEGRALVSDGPLTHTIRGVLTNAGAGFVDSVPVTPVDQAVAGRPERLAAVVLDATGARVIDDLAAAQQFLTPAVRRLGPCGRIVVLAPAVGPDAAVEAAAVAQGLEGFVRSVAKELRDGATANMLVVEPDGEDGLPSPLRFLLSARSAFVSGQVLHVGEPVGPVVGAESRVGVVTGAARGIGAAIAEVLARGGVDVVAVDIPAAGEALAGVANRIHGTALPLDITADDAGARILDHVRERHGRLDVVVHNAGITRDKLLANMDADRWNSVLAVNLRAQLAINAGVLSSELLSDTGRIVSISSTSGIAGNRGQSNYAASKAGVIGMVRAEAPRLAERGVTMNAVAPGFIETDMTARMPALTREAGRRVNSLRQGGLPVDVAEAVAWLGQADAAGVTGQVLRVCGQSVIGA